MKLGAANWVPRVGCCELGAAWVLRVWCRELGAARVGAAILGSVSVSWEVGGLKLMGVVEFNTYNIHTANINLRPF